MNTDAKKQVKNKKWKCVICGFIFEGTKPPEVCPLCGASKNQFIEVVENNSEFKNSSEYTYIIIGNGAAGFYAAEAIRKTDESAKIEIISSEDYRTYFRPKLSNYLGEDIPDKKFYLKDMDFYEENNIELSLSKTVSKINPDSKEIVLSDGATKNYDKLILANGSYNFVPPVEGKDLNGVYTLKYLKDADEIKNQISRVKEAVIIGGGLLGLEAAAQMIKSGLKVTVVEFSERLIPRQLDKQGSDIFKDIIDKSGINIILGDSAVKITGEENVSAVELKSGKTIPAQLVLFSVGIRSNKDLAEEAGIKTDRGILVDDKMQTSIKDIYAAGDAAQINGRVYGNWPSAVQMGKVAGYNAAGGDEKFRDFVSSVTFNELGASILSFGEIEPEGFKKVQISHQSNIKTLYFKDGVLKGGYLIGDIKDGPKLIIGMKKFLRIDDVAKLI